MARTGETNWNNIPLYRPEKVKMSNSQVAYLIILKGFRLGKSDELISTLHPNTPQSTVTAMNALSHAPPKGSSDTMSQ